MNKKKKYLIHISTDFEIEIAEKENYNHIDDRSNDLEKQAQEKIINNFKDNPEIKLVKKSIELHAFQEVD